MQNSSSLSGHLRALPSAIIHLASKAQAFGGFRFTSLIFGVPSCAISRVYPNAITYRATGCSFSGPTLTSLWIEPGIALLL